jgi:hypothetical protein
VDPLSGKTGIAIHAGMSQGTRPFGKILKALHLEQLGAHYARSSVMVISIDGVDRSEPFYEAHFVECAPGEHDVTVSVQQTASIGHGPAAPSSLQKAFTSKTLRVSVAPGQVVHMTYTPGATGSALELQLRAPEDPYR